MAEKLYAAEDAGLTGAETVYDLYCGTGTIGLSMADHALSVWGVDISEESIACALENLELNQIGNAAFFAGNVGQVLEELAERAGPPDVVVVDPPRAGLAGKALKRTGELRRRGLSTSPATRPPSPPTSRRCASSSATSLCGRGRSTCSRTPRTSRPCRCWLTTDLRFRWRRMAILLGAAGGPSGVRA